MNTIEIEIYNQENELVGDGPLMSADIIDPSWEDTLCELGSFSFRVLANSPFRDHLTDIRNHIKIIAYYHDPKVTAYSSTYYDKANVFDGQITDTSIILDASGIPYIEVRGLSLAAELADVVCHINFSAREYPYTAPRYVVDNFAARYPTKQWMLTPGCPGQQTTFDVGQLAAYFKISYFEFLVNIADYTRSCFRVEPNRRIYWINQDYPSCKLHACYLDYYDKDDLPLDTLPIKSLTVGQVSNTAVSSVFAQGQGDFWLDHNWDPGSPWRVRNLWGGVVLENLDTIAAYGEHQVYKKFGSATSQEALQRLAQTYLINNSEPQYEYSLEVANLVPGKCMPGHSIRVDYDGVDETGRYYSIHRDLVIISIAHTIDSDTKRYVGTLTLSDKVTRVLDNGDIVQMLTARLTDAYAVG